MRAAILAMVGSLLAPSVGAQPIDCYGTGSRRLREVGDYSTFRDQNSIVDKIVVTSESYDAGLNVQEVTTQTVGGPSDGNVYFYRYSMNQNLFDGFDRSILGASGPVLVSTRNVPAIPINFPICPGSMQSSEGDILMTAPGFVPCTGSYQQSLVATQWEEVTVPIGIFRALRVEQEIDLMFDSVCGLDPVTESSVVWLAPGPGSVRTQSGSVVRVLVDAKPEPVPEPEASSLCCTALVSLTMLRRWKALSSWRFGPARFDIYTTGFAKRLRFSYSEQTESSRSLE